VKRAAPLALAVVLALGIAWAISQASGTSTPVAGEGPATPGTELVGGFGSLGGSGASGPSIGLSPDPRRDAGRAAYDGGVRSDHATTPTSPSAPLDPSDVPVMITLPGSTPNDAYDTANVVWGALAMRREQLRAELDAARAADDAEAIRRLERTLVLVDTESARLEQRMRTLAPSRVDPAPVDSAHTAGAEGAAP
jgi:hypothetical protein